MKLVKISLFLTILLASSPSSLFAGPNISISRWEEVSKLTKLGKNSEVLVQGKIGKLPPNRQMTSFSISFAKSQNIKVNNVILDSKIAKYSFINNVLNITFPKGKRSKESLLIYISYNEQYKEVHKFLREELITVPDFAKGAKAQVVVQYPKNLRLTSATLNPNVIQKENKFIYRSIVPENGITESIKLTPQKSTWDVSIKTKIISNQPLKNMTVTIPDYFKNGGQKFTNVVMNSNLDNINRRSQKGSNIIKFNSKKRIAVIETRAKVFAGKEYQNLIARDPKDYLEIDAAQIVLLSPLLQKIKANPEYKNLPLYAKIGRFVNNFISYDISYIGHLPAIDKILASPIGVCTEYSNLYNSLARLARIPSFIVQGGACGEYDECQGHSWNMIYHNNKWINVDATWDLMSGKVSSSHIFFNDDANKEVMIKYITKGNKNKPQLKSKIDFVMKNLG